MFTPELLLPAAGVTPTTNNHQIRKIEKRIVKARKAQSQVRLSVKLAKRISYNMLREKIELCRKLIMCL